MLVFDIETGPRPEEELRLLLPDFDPDIAVPPLGEFDESTVKFGNAKKADTRAAIVDAAREAHYAAELDRPQRIEQARENHWANFIDKAALDPVKGRVLAIGYRDDNDYQVEYYGGSPENTESYLVSYCWKRMAASEGSIAGFNSNGFDLPFLVRRSWLLGIDVPDWVRNGRYWNNRFVDIQELWSLGTKGPNFVSLDTVARAFGIPGKGGEVTGANFAEYFWGDRYKQLLALDYLAHDINMTWQIADKMQLL